ncbi:unnamed protein product [Mytilus coruscus]|uniref:Uncharacterized protein n=1 Tax=Mytilus coruscus TaxID=42192 RepID=A0A6J8D4Y2_MYTCO|nr:unnamed protein product [Mytilus coruscus]
MFKFREKYGKGVRQRSVRSNTTKFNAETLPMNMYQNNIPPKCSPIDLLVSDVREVQTGELVPTRPTNQEQSDDNHVGEVVYEENDLLAIMMEDQLCIGKVVTRVFDTTNICKVMLYKEKSRLNFHKDTVRDIPVDTVLEVIASPLCFLDVYTLDGDIYNRLTNSVQTDSLTVSEKVRGS